MPALDALIPGILVGILLAILLVFTFGTQRNISRGNAVLRWLQDSLPRLGQRTTLRWLGSSVVELRLSDTTEPFRELTILAVMEPRDVPILWVFSRARGRRDVLIFRASLRRAPRVELDVSDPTWWMRAEDSDEEAGWRTIDWPDEARALARGLPGPAALDAARAAWEALTNVTAGVWRVSVRQTVPHLEIHVRPPDSASTGSAPLVEAVRRLALDITPSD